MSFTTSVFHHRCTHTHTHANHHQQPCSIARRSAPLVPLLISLARHYQSFARRIVQHTSFPDSHTQQPCHYRNTKHTSSFIKLYLLLFVNIIHSLTFLFSSSHTYTHRPPNDGTVGAGQGAAWRGQLVRSCLSSRSPPSLCRMD